MKPETIKIIRENLPKYRKDWADELYKILLSNGIDTTRAYMYMVLNWEDPRTNPEIEQLAFDYLKKLIQDEDERQKQILQPTQNF